MLTMNEKDKNEMLEAILNENEAYQCKLWAVIMAGADTYALIGGLSTLTGGAAAALGALSNAYCYMGITEKHLNMVIVNSVNVSKIENRLSQHQNQQQQQSRANVTEQIPLQTAEMPVEEENTVVRNQRRHSILL